MTAWWVLWALIVVWLAATVTRRVRREASNVDRIIADAQRTRVLDGIRHDVGPDSLRLLEDLDRHLDTYADQVAGLYEPMPSPDPVLAAGAHRVRAAINDQRKEGN